MSNKTLIVNYNNLRLGGTEVVFAYLMKYSIEKGYRVIWLTKKRDYANTDFSKVLADDRVEKVFWGGAKKAYSVPKIEYNQEAVVMISCHPLDYIIAEGIRQKAPHISFKHLLILPHFRSYECYPERYFNFKPIKKVCIFFMKRYAQKWTLSNSVYAFALKHLNTYEKSYDVIIKGKEKRVLPRIKPVVEIDSERIEQLAENRKDFFGIITCCRFEFPHKGYVIGLIDSYARLKRKYPQITLTIVGYGDDLSIVQEKIRLLPEDIRQGISLPGALSYDELMEYFAKAHLNVGLAGALVDGARCGVPSIAVRHHDYACEAYGFYVNNTKKGLSDEPGMELDSYIEEIILLDNEEYLEHCYSTREVALKQKEYNPEYVFEQSDASERSVVSKMDIFWGKVLKFATVVHKTLYNIHYKR